MGPSCAGRPGCAHNHLQGDTSLLDTLSDRAATDDDTVDTDHTPRHALYAADKVTSYRHHQPYAYSHNTQEDSCKPSNTRQAVSAGAVSAAAALWWSAGWEGWRGGQQSGVPAGGRGVVGGR